MMIFPSKNSTRNIGLRVLLGIWASLIGLRALAAAPVNFVVTENGKPACEIVLPAEPSELTRHAARRLQSSVKEVSGVELPIVTEGRGGGNRARILVGSLAESSSAAAFLREKGLIVPLSDREQHSLKRALISKDLAAEGFVIYAGEYEGHPTAVLTGHTPLGGLYAVETVSDRLYQEGNRVLAGPLNSETLPVVNVPAFRVRSIATNLGGPDWLAGGQWEKEWKKEDGSYDWRGFVDWMVSHKINNLNAWIFNLAFGIAYDSERFPELVNHHHPNVKHEFMKDLIDYAHSRGIKVFIMIDFPDNWTAVVKAYPELAGKNFNPADIPDGPEWENYQKYGARVLGRGGTQKFRSSYSWACGTEPKTMQFWKEYWEELLEHYPNLDGIGLQVSEGDKSRCNGDRCERIGPFAIHEKFFAEMVTVGRRVNPKMKVWIYDSWGTRDILLHQDRYPNFINIDWGRPLAAFYYRQYLPRSNWYLFHRSTDRFPEFAYKYVARALNERNVEAMQIRAPAYKPYDNAYQAFEEFSWNPRLSIEQYADLYIRKLYHRPNPQLAELYAAWMNFLGYQELARPRRGALFYENPNQEEDQAHAVTAKARVARLLGQIRNRSELVGAIREKFEALRE